MSIDELTKANLKVLETQRHRSTVDYYSALTNLCKKERKLIKHWFDSVEEFTEFHYKNSLGQYQRVLYRDIMILSPKTERVKLVVCVKCGGSIIRVSLKNLYTKQGDSYQKLPFLTSIE